MNFKQKSFYAEKEHDFGQTLQMTLWTITCNIVRSCSATTTPDFSLMIVKHTELKPFLCWLVWVHMS